MDNGCKDKANVRNETNKMIVIDVCCLKVTRTRCNRRMNGCKYEVDRVLDGKTSCHLYKPITTFSALTPANGVKKSTANLTQGARVE